MASLVHGGTSPTHAPDSFSEEDIRRDRVDYRHWLLSHTQRMLYFAGVEGSMRGCLQGVFTRWSKREKDLIARAELHSYGGRLHWVGITHCKSPLCPVCGPILAAKRMEEAQVASEKLLRAGYSYLFPTFTASHLACQSLSEIRAKFKIATDEFTKTREYKKLREVFGWRFSFSSFEITDDAPITAYAKKTGWHLHKHSVFWLDSPWLSEEETEAFRLVLLAGWKKALKKAGLSCSDERGVYIQTIQRHAEKTGLRVAFDKLSGEKQKKYLDQVCAYVSKSLGFEMTGTGRKKGKLNLYGGERISHWRLLELAIMGDKRARVRWLELFEALQDSPLSSFKMSPGLRDFCGLGKEKTDDELMGETEAARPVLIFGPYRDRWGKDKKDFEWDAWRPIAKQGRLSAFCSIMEDASESDPVSLASSLIGAASCGFDLKSEKWLDQSGLDPVWQGYDCAMVAKDRPWPEAEKRLAAEDQAAMEQEKQAVIDAWLSKLEAYTDEVGDLDQELWASVSRHPDLYAVGRVTKEKREAWAWVLRYGLWDAMCWYLRDLGYAPPPDRPDESGPEQGRLWAA